jgi:hypothetical protein
MQVPLKMKDPEFFRRYFYMVSVVQQQFYKGIVPSLRWRQVQYFYVEHQAYSYPSIEKGH